MLERIVTDRGVETAAQIEALRDRDAIEDGGQSTMNHGELMVVLIVAIVMIASIFRAKYGYGRSRRRVI